MTNSINDLDYAAFDASDPTAVARRVITADQGNITAGFSSVGASVLDSKFHSPIVGSGVTYNQAAGSLNIVSGVATNAEFLARSKQGFKGSMRLRFSVVGSQRIANNNMAVLLADLVGEGLAYTIVNATTVNVTVPSHGFTAQMVGQSVLIGGITGAAGVPGRYAIASIVDVDTVQFTVAGWPASGSGTCTVFGRNYVRNLFTGTTATNVAWDVQRNGWATGDTTATINSTASPGTLVASELTGRDAFLSDALRASATVPTFTTRASRYENIPDPDMEMFVFLWGFNGTTAPASATTWTFGHVVVEDFPNSPVYIQGFRAQGSQNPSPVSVTSGTVSTVSNLAAIAAGTNAIGDVGVQYRATATGAASIRHIVSAASTNATIVKAAAGRVVGWHLANTTAAYRYVKLHNIATAPTAGAGVVQTIAIPPNGVVSGTYVGGIGFATGIGLTIVTGSADADATAVAVGDVVGDVFFA
jgi:hypothetical protein